VARELGQSIVVIGPVVKELVEQGALHLADGRRPAAATPGGPAGDLVLPPGAVHAVRNGGTEDAAPLVTSVPDPAAELDRDALERERAVLAARAGLDAPGPVPTEEPGVDAEDEEDPDHTVTMTTDRGALLRLFSGLRDQG
jgi:hypothetical protein